MVGQAEEGGHMMGSRENYAYNRLAPTRTMPNGTSPRPSPLPASSRRNPYSKWHIDETARIVTAMTQVPMATRGDMSRFAAIAWGDKR